MTDLPPIHVDAKDDDSMADPVLLAWLRHIDGVLHTLCDQIAAQDQRLTKIEDAQRLLTTAVERRDAALAQWIDPAIDVTGLIAQLAEIGRNNIEAVDGLATLLRREMAATRSAIDLAVGAAGVGEFEGLEREIA